MTTTAKVIADSLSPFTGDRLTTLQLRYPRFIHAEELTHRVLGTQPQLVLPDGLMYDRDLSRNASSSRAVPVERLIQDVLDDPAIPVHWGKNQPGMQAREEHDAVILFENDGTLYARDAWLLARDQAVDIARRFAAAGYHKQVVNRLLEPFAHINVVVTATDWDNFFLLRDHEDADPNIQLLARAMREAMAASEPVTVDRDFGWHLPYVGHDDMADISAVTSVIDTDGLYEYAAKISAARCARVSYMTHDGRRSTIDEDLTLFNRLVGAQIKHASPLEHQARPQAGRWANFQGWRSFRNIMEDDWA